MKALSGKSVVITGAGRGIGAACAKGVARLGAAVIVNDIDEEVAEATAAAIRAEGGKAVAYVADICSWTQAGELMARCVKEFGGLDGLVNNAGLFAMARLDELDESSWRKLIDVNVLGTVHCAAHAIKHMKARGAGSIVNVTSGAHMGIPTMGIYGATKGAVASMTYAWAMELKDSGIRVNALSPQGETGMVKVTEAYFAARGLPRPVTNSPPPDTNSPVVEFLLSDAAREVTGQIVRADGPQLALCVHPGILMPILSNQRWDFESVRKAFESDLAQRQLALGIVGLKIAETVANPSAAWNPTPAGT